MTKRPSWGDISERLLELLKQGSTPEKLAFTIALGIAIGCFPIFGVTTILCALLAILFRLNVPAIQVGNYLATPLQLALLVPFLRWGERLFHAARLSLSPQELLTQARNAPDQTARAFLLGQWHAVAAWLLIAPFMVLVFTLLLRPVMRTIMARIAPAGSQALRPGAISTKQELFPAD